MDGLFLTDNLVVPCMLGKGLRQAVPIKQHETKKSKQQGFATILIVAGIE